MNSPLNDVHLQHQKSEGQQPDRCAPTALDEGKVLAYFLNPDHKQCINMTASIYNTSLGKLVGYRIGPLLASEGFDRTTFLTVTLLIPMYSILLRNKIW